MAIVVTLRKPLSAIFICQPLWEVPDVVVYLSVASAKLIIAILASKIHFTRIGIGIITNIVCHLRLI